jgi:hypothetical protein
VRANRTLRSLLLDRFYEVQGKFSDKNHKWTRINTKLKKEEATTDGADDRK